MDWPESTEPVLTAFPRGMARDGGTAGPDVVVRDNPVRWTSKYGSLATTIYGIGTADGINEAGLAAHMLYLNAADFGPRDPSKPGLHAGLAIPTSALGTSLTNCSAWAMSEIGSKAEVGDRALLGFDPSYIFFGRTILIVEVA